MPSDRFLPPPAAAAKRQTSLPTRAAAAAAAARTLTNLHTLTSARAVVPSESGPPSASAPGCAPASDTLPAPRHAAAKRKRSRFTQLLNYSISPSPKTPHPAPPPPPPPPPRALSAALQRRLSRMPRMHLHIAAPTPLSRRARHETDLVLVHTCVYRGAARAPPAPHGPAAAAADRLDSPGGGGGEMNAVWPQWQAAAVLHLLPAVISLPVTPADFAHTLVRLSLHAGAKQLGAVTAPMSHLVHPFAPPLALSHAGLSAAPRRPLPTPPPAMLLSVRACAPPTRALLAAGANGLALTATTAPSMRREARQATTLSLERLAPPTPPLPIAHALLSRRTGHTAVLAAPAPALAFGLEGKRAARAVVQIVWRGAPPRRARAHASRAGKAAVAVASAAAAEGTFVHGAFEWPLADMASLAAGQLHGVPWCEAAGAPVVARSVLVESVELRDGLWCIELTLTR